MGIINIEIIIIIIIIMKLQRPSLNFTGVNGTGVRLIFQIEKGKITITV